VSLRGWLRFAAGRLLALIVTILGLVVVTFSMVRLIPGDPVQAVAGLTSTQAERTRLTKEMGLNHPYFTQFGHYLINLLHWNLGTSFTDGQSVSQQIGQEIGSSLILAGVSLALVLIVAIPLGLIVAALTQEGRHPRIDMIFTGATSFFGSIPQFLLATFLAFIFAIWLKILPVAGYNPPVSSIILPTVSIALAPVAILSRLVRIETLNVLTQDYIRTARGKRLPTRIIYLRHVLPNVLTAALTLGGVIFAYIIAGAVIIENVFNRPGLGTGLIGAVQQNNYPVIQGIILVLGLIVVAVNAIVDLAVGFLDPRSLNRPSSGATR
jgi:peptide/nickel transport system permease protein